MSNHSTRSGAPCLASETWAGSPQRLRRLLTSFAVCLLAVIMLGANDPSARFGRIGHNMMCVCSCQQVLLECNHVGCPDSARMIGELHDQVDGPGGGLSSGGSDAAIYKWFESKYGAVVLAAPIRGGFDNLAWILPVALFLFAIFGTTFLVRMWGNRRRLTPTTAGLPLPPDDAVRDRIRRETEWP